MALTGFANLTNLIYAFEHEQPTPTPSTYTEVKYLERSSAGPFAIDISGFGTVSSFSFATEMWQNNGSSEAAIGFSNNYRNFELFFAELEGTQYLAFYSQEAGAVMDAAIPSPKNQFFSYSLSLSGGTATATLNQTTKTASFSIPGGWSTIRLFQYTDGSYFSSCRMKEIDLTVNDLSCHLVPAIRDSDGQPGLYDEDRDVFYENVFKNQTTFGYETMDGTYHAPVVS